MAKTFECLQPILTDTFSDMLARAFGVPPFAPPNHTQHNPDVMVSAEKVPLPVAAALGGWACALYDKAWDDRDDWDDCELGKELAATFEESQQALTEALESALPAAFSVPFPASTPEAKKWRPAHLKEAEKPTNVAGQCMANALQEIRAFVIHVRTAPSGELFLATECTRVLNAVDQLEAGINEQRRITREWRVRTLEEQRLFFDGIQARMAGSVVDIDDQLKCNATELKALEKAE